MRPAPIYARGAITYYTPYTMEATAEWRGMSLEGYVDGISLMSPSDIGLEVWLRRPGTYKEISEDVWIPLYTAEWEGPFLVVDCAMKGDEWPIIANRGEIAEVGFKTAERWGLAAQDWRGVRYWQWRINDVEISKVPPQFLADAEAIDFPEWWEERAEFVNPYLPWEPRPLQIAPLTWKVGEDIIEVSQPDPLIFVKRRFRSLRRRLLNIGGIQWRSTLYQSD